MVKKTGRFVYWTPRILSIIFLLFLALMSLDVISPELTFWQIIGGMIMHNIPVFILAVLLWISWKREIIGAVTFISAGLLYIGLTAVNVFRNEFEWYMLSWIIQISGVAFFIGILFWIGWKRRKANKFSKK